MEKLLPKALVQFNKPLVTLTSNVQRGLVKTFLASFVLTLGLAALVLVC